MDELREILLSEIVWPDPIREEINKGDVDKMAKSIMATGQIQAIVVQQVTDHLYNGVVGRLRYLGAEEAHVTTILARIHAFSDESEKTVWQLVENLVRRELNPIVKAEAMEKLRQQYEDELGESAAEPIVDSIRKEVAEVSGEEAPSKKTVWKYLDMAKSIPDDVKKLLKSLARESFGQRHAEQLLRLKDDHAGMLKAAEYLIQNKPTSNTLKAWIDDYWLVRETAVKNVKEAAAKGEISMKQAASISSADSEIQKPILDITKKGSLSLAQTKKMVDFAELHTDRVEELLKVGEEHPEQAVKLAEGEGTVNGNVLLRTKDKEEYKIPCTCPNCLTKFETTITVNWKKGEFSFV